MILYLSVAQVLALHVVGSVACWRCAIVGCSRPLWPDRR
jgi:hypothetical protein